MNKDLEIIKKNLDYFLLNRTDKYGRESAKNIINLAAERMVAEIERLAQYEKFYPDKHKAHLQLMDRYNEALADITALKAELEKRPEVVFCKNCKLAYRCNQKVFVIGETMNLRTITLCDAGESEGK